MRDFFIGRRVELLTEEREEEIKIWRMDLEGPEVGHMACRRSDYATFLYVGKGQIDCRTERHLISLSEGEACFINGGRFYRFEKSVQGGVFYLLEISDEYLSAGFLPSLKEKYISAVKRSEGLDVERFEPAGDEDSDENILLQALYAAAETAKIRDTAYELDLKSWILTAWGSFYKIFLRNSYEYKRAALREREKMARMLEYIGGHYNEKLTLSGLAGCSGVSGGEYCRFFKKHMNLTPFEYLQKCRIEHSMNELLGKSVGMAEVALHHGFGGSSYYAETFKKEMGCAPGEYRKWYRGDIEACPLKFSGGDSRTSGEKYSKEEIPAHLL